MSRPVPMIDPKTFFQKKIDRRDHAIPRPLSIPLLPYLRRDSHWSLRAVYQYLLVVGGGRPRIDSGLVTGRIALASILERSMCSAASQ